eukprot:scaffold2187_cov182-Ochromonas_danica.AAC.1
MKNQNQSSHHPRRGGNGGSGGGNTWKMITICLLVTIIPWALYVNFHPQIITLPAQSSSSTTTADAILANQLKSSPGVGGIVESLSKVGNDNKNYPQLQQQLPPPSSSSELAALIKETTTTTSSSLGGVITNVKNQLPVLGPVPMNGAKPLYELQHKGTDGIFALACNYPKVYYQRFVGSLRKFGYTEDIVLAVSPQPKMKPGVNDYLKKTGVLAYEFDVDCQGKDDCKLKDDFLGYPDPRPYRTFANIRYGVVNTVGAMNGYRVPKEKKGPLGTFWKARDEEGYVINKDGSRSACVHQWDRWFDELHGFIDKNLFD